MSILGTGFLSNPDFSSQKSKTPFTRPLLAEFCRCGGKSWVQFLLVGYFLLNGLACQKAYVEAPDEAIYVVNTFPSNGASVDPEFFAYGDFHILFFFSLEVEVTTSKQYMKLEMDLEQPTEILLEADPAYVSSTKMNALQILIPTLEPGHFYKFTLAQGAKALDGSALQEDFVLLFYLRPAPSQDAGVGDGGAEDGSLEPDGGTEDVSQADAEVTDDTATETDITPEEDVTVESAVEAKPIIPAFFSPPAE